MYDNAFVHQKSQTENKTKNALKGYMPKFANYPDNFKRLARWDFNYQLKVQYQRYEMNQRISHTFTGFSNHPI